MNHLSRRRLLLASGAMMLAAGRPAAALPVSASAPEAPLPSDSVYQLAIRLTDQHGKTFQLAEQRGSPRVLSMFYTGCQFVCPMLMEAIRANEQQLPAAERARLKVTLVSFDPAHDSVPVLRETAQAHGVDSTRWTLARTDAASVRKLAALLGIQYRAMGNGEFNHATSLILVDADGRITGRTNEVAGADPQFVKLLQRSLAGA